MNTSVSHSTKRIEDFVQILYSEVRADGPLPLDLFIYLEKNRTVIRWRKASDSPSHDLLQQTETRGIKHLWIRKSDFELWQRYLKGEPAASAATDPAPQWLVQNLNQNAARTDEGKLLQSIVQNPLLSSKQKAALVTLSARELVSYLVQKGLQGDEAPLPSRDQVRDILDLVFQNTDPSLKKIILEIWTLSELNSDLSHLRNVTIYAVLFALASGDMDDSLLIDLILASLLHDIGITQIPAHITSLHRSRLNDEQRETYALHVKATLSLIQTAGLPLSERSRNIIYQHHERFGGGGYPRGLNGFQIFEITQKLILADFLDSLISGRWDGRKRSLREGFKLIESLEASHGRADHIDPEWLKKIPTWIQAGESQPNGLTPAQVIEKKLNHFLNRNEPTAA